ncbi:MAG: BCD family MFS transporter [Pseudomonadota bacterium]
MMATHEAADQTGAQTVGSSATEEQALAGDGGRPISWGGLFRLGLVQVALGSIVVLTTSTLNRVMVVELALPAMVPGILIALHYAVQISRPRWGFGADRGGRRTPWVIGGIAVLAAGGTGAAGATLLMATSEALGLFAAVLAFTMIGLGVGMAGTNLLALIAVRTAPARRPAAATLAWLMMIAGIAVTAGVAGQLLDPFSPARLMAVSGGISLVACLLATLGVLGIEPRQSARVARPIPDPGRIEGPPRFAEALGEVWRDTAARRFTVFVFVSMLAYSAQDLILEPFAGHVFAFTPGESTGLAGTQHGGVFLGMLLTGLVASRWGRGRQSFLTAWSIGGCLASALALLGLAVGAHTGGTWPLSLNVFLLGLSNGAFAVAAISAMMSLATRGGAGRAGTRMGLWGAAQAIGFGLGNLGGAVAVDIARALSARIEIAYAAVFTAEAVLFLVSALLAAHAARRLADATKADAPARAVRPGAEITTDADAVPPRPSHPLPAGE